MRRFSVSRIGVFALAAVTAAAYSAVYATSASSAARSLTPAVTQKSLRLTGIQHVKVRTGTSAGWAGTTRRYKVRGGDSLSLISEREYGNPGCWPGIYRSNKDVIGSNPDIIYPAQVYGIPSGCDERPVARYVTVSAMHVQHSSAADSEPDADGDDGSRRTVAAVRAPGPVSAPVQASSSFQACVIQRESGGNADIWNASGHWGLYQFSYSTWVAAGGDGALFGRASAGYQTQIFWNAFRLWGSSPWAPYDGCSL